MKRVELKLKARHSLINNFKETTKTLLIYYVISFAIVFVINLLGLREDTASLLTYTVGIIVGGLIYFGYNSFFLKVSRNEEVTFKELFSKTNMFFSCIGISILIGIFTVFGTFLFIFPGIITSINYSIAYFVALDNPNLGVMEVLNKSKDIMNGYKWDFFILSLSFLGWVIVGIFTFGILYLWLIPYMQITIANFYNEIK